MGARTLEVFSEKDCTQEMKRIKENMEYNVARAKEYKKASECEEYSQLDRECYLRHHKQYLLNATRYRSEYTKLKSQIKSGVAEIILTEEQLADLICENQFVVPNSVKIYNSKSFSFEFSGVCLRIPGRGSSHAFRSVSDMPVRLPDMKVAVNISVFEYGIRFFALNDEDRFRGYNGCLTVHPHVLSDGGPCLGGYDSMVHDAVRKQKDMFQVVMLLQMYLESLDRGDVAGGNWINLLAKRSFFQKSRMADIPSGYYWSNSDESGTVYTIMYPRDRDWFPSTPPHKIFKAMMDQGVRFQEAYVSPLKKDGTPRANAKLVYTVK